MFKQNTTDNYDHSADSIALTSHSKHGDSVATDARKASRAAPRSVFDYFQLATLTGILVSLIGILCVLMQMSNAVTAVTSISGSSQ
jgi:hypothetical protein